MIANRVQEEAFGTLDRATLKLLDGLARRGVLVLGAGFVPADQPPHVHKLGWLTTLDHMAFGAYCAFAARWIEAERQLEVEGVLARGSTGNTVAHPLFQIAVMSARQMIRDLAHGLHDVGEAAHRTLRWRGALAEARTIGRAVFTAITVSAGRDPLTSLGGRIVSYKLIFAQILSTRNEFLRECQGVLKIICATAVYGDVPVKIDQLKPELEPIVGGFNKPNLICTIPR